MCIRSLRVSSWIFVGLCQAVAARAVDRYVDDFAAAALGPLLEARNYALEDGGSFSDLSALDLGIIDGAVVVAGVASHSVTVRDDKPVGWIGRALTYDLGGAGGVISVECDAAVLEYEPGGGGFQLTLLIEFSSNDRVMFSLVEPLPHARRQFEITVDENNGLRFTPRQRDIQNLELVHTRLEVDCTTRSISGFVNGELWQQDTFAGTISGAPRAGLAVTLRAPGDRIQALFDNLAITYDPPFRRGDANGDDTINISDAVSILNFLFTEENKVLCYSAADADDSGGLQITDPVRLLRVLFGTSPPIPRPSPDCGIDPTRDELTCPGSRACSG